MLYVSVPILLFQRKRPDLFITKIIFFLLWLLIHYRLSFYLNGNPISEGKNWEDGGRVKGYLSSTLISWTKLPNILSRLGLGLSSTCSVPWSFLLLVNGTLHSRPRNEPVSLWTGLSLGVVSCTYLPSSPHNFGVVYESDPSVPVLPLYRAPIN